MTGLRILIAAVLGLAGAVAAADAPPTLRAVRVSRPPVLDGRLDDAAWSQAAPFSAFRQAIPDPGTEPSERTELRIVYDGSGPLYRRPLLRPRACPDLRQHAWPTTGERTRNIPATTSSRSSSILSRTSATPIVFVVNPRGARQRRAGLRRALQPGLGRDLGRQSPNSARTAGAASCAIPFRTISFKADLPSWGLNVERYIARRQETIRLSGIRRDAYFYNATEAAPLEGIAGVRQGTGLDLPALRHLERRPRCAPRRPETARKAGRRFRSLQELHSQFRRRFQLQHRFRRDRGRRAPHQPDPLSSLLPGKADVFPRRARRSSISPDRTASRDVLAVFQPPHRPAAREGRSPSGVRGQGLRPGGGYQHQPCSTSGRGTSRTGCPARNFSAGRISQNIFAESQIGFLFTDGQSRRRPQHPGRVRIGRTRRRASTETRTLRSSAGASITGTVWPPAATGLWSQARLSERSLGHQCELRLLRRRPGPRPGFPAPPGSPESEPRDQLPAPA